MEKEIPQLQEIAGKEWEKEDELKRLKTELAAQERKIQLDLAPFLPEQTRRDSETVQTTPGIPEGTATVRLLEGRTMESASMPSETAGTPQSLHEHVQIARTKPVEEKEPGKGFKL